MAKSAKGQLEFNLGLDSSQFEAGGKQVNRSLEQIQGAMKDANVRLKELQAQLAQAGATATAAGQKIDKAIGQEFRSSIAQAKADVAKLNAEMAKVGGGSAALPGTGMFAGLRDSIAGLATPLAAAGAAWAAFNQALRISNIADALDDVSAATGNSIGSLRTLQTSLVDAGGNVEDMEKIAAKFSISVGEAAEGNDKMIESFKRLQVPIKDVNGEMRAQDDILQDAIKAIAGIENPAQRAAVAVDLFGKSAAKLDFTKLDAARNFETEQSVKNITALKGELEKLSAFIDNVLIGVFGSLAKSINNAFPSNTTARVERLTKAIGDMEAKASKNGGLGFGDTQALKLWKKKLAEVTDEANKASEASLRASAGPRGGTGSAYTPTVVKDSQYGTSKNAAKNAEKEVKDAAKNAEREAKEAARQAEREAKDAASQAEREAKEAAREAEKLAREREKAQREAFAASMNELKSLSDIFKASLGLAQQAYDQSYRDGLVSLKGYNEARLDIVRSQTASELKLIDDQIAASQKEMEIADISAERKSELSKNIQSLNAQRAAAEINGQKSINAELDAGVQRLDAYAKRMASIQAEAAGLGGDYTGAADAAKAAIDVQYQKELNQVRANGNAQELAALERVIAAQKAAADQKAIQLQYSKEIGNLGVREAQIQSQKNAGLISEAAAEEQLRLLAIERLTTELQIAEAKLKVAGISQQEADALTAQIETIKAQIQGVGNGLVNLNTFATNQLQKSLGDAFGAVVSGAKTAKEAVKDLVKSMIQSLANQALQNSLKGLFGGAGFGGAGLFGGLGKLFGFAHGGVVPRVSGADNTPRGDGVLARLSPGEVVINNRAADLLGRGWLDSLNSLRSGAQAAANFRMSVPKPPRVSTTNRLADGGVVGPANAETQMMKVEVINKGGDKVATGAEVDMKGNVTRIFLDDLRRGGDMAKAVKAVR